jgi:hypothetical protein
MNQNYLPVDMDDEESMINMPVDAEDMNIEFISELMTVLELEESRSASYRRSWLRERKRTRSTLLKLRILTNDTRQMVFENTFRDRQNGSRRIRSVEDIEAVLTNEKIWSAFYFKGWMNERSQRQRLELQLLSMS